MKNFDVGDIVCWSHCNDAPLMINNVVSNGGETIYVLQHNGDSCFGFALKEELRLCE